MRDEGSRIYVSTCQQNEISAEDAPWNALSSAFLILCWIDMVTYYRRELREKHGLSKKVQKHKVNENLRIYRNYKTAYNTFELWYKTQKAQYYDKLAQEEAQKQVDEEIEHRRKKEERERRRKEKEDAKRNQAETKYTL